MKVVAVIAEYNPFHLGHKHHLEEIRRAFGEDTAIVILLSGNYVQRGDLAIFDKYTRAEAAIHGGADLVLELPYPYSCANAEAYADSAVQILKGLGIVDILSFGSECGNINTLQEAAKRMQSAPFKNAFQAAVNEKRSMGHAALCECVYRELYGDASLLTSPNNTLALEYLMAIERHGNPFSAHTVLRESDYHTGKGKYPSASVIRAQILSKNIEEVQRLIPANAFSVFQKEIAQGVAPASLASLSRSAVAALFLYPPPHPEGIADGEGGLGNRILSVLDDSLSIEELIGRAKTAKYTNARIRRAILHLLFGTTKEDMQKKPAFTQLLAFNATGRSLLKEIKRVGTVSLLTKPADLSLLPEEAMRQARCAHRADSVYLLSLPAPQASLHPLRRTPYCEK